MSKLFHDIRPEESWDLWLSEQFCTDSENITEEGNVAYGNEVARPYQLLVRRSRLNSFFERFTRTNKKVALLSAHGGTLYGKWKWLDLPDTQSVHSYSSVDEWVRARDEEDYGLIIVGVCNPDNFRIKTERTPLIFPQGIIGLLCDYTAIGYNPQTKRSTKRFVERLGD